MYTVKHAATLTGIPADTLRVWERRYGVVSPARSEGGYRLYDDASLRRLRAMGALVGAGWSARQAAARVLADEEAGTDDAPDPGVTPIGDVDALARVAATFDVAGLDAALDAGFALGTFEEVVDGWLMPSLLRLGAAWRHGAVLVAGEHLVSASVQRRLAAAYDAAGPVGGGPRVVVGLARGSRHELGVLAFATALRRAGGDVVYVGGDLPPDGWVAVVAEQRPAAAVLGVPSSDDVVAVRETVAALAAAHPDLPVNVGGGHQHAVSGAHRLGHLVGPAAAALAADLADGLA
ncbi:MerR family transcriptional regulator [Nocardioides guangzhouensis]|uniref:MerR family transcriptional regulator n=1 Tax=Nocardioides guangzhouensis TaxID=2497878 RepID=A0A4Q4ZJX0_9ACTN|nr:MerR family transcriptional regulator [Nocardioides guangzhouensis]RYP88298.1 MerR family transcriptional regulator [Nocardioides guangzhouensis]